MYHFFRRKSPKSRFLQAGLPEYPFKLISSNFFSAVGQNWIKLSYTTFYDGYNIKNLRKDLVSWGGIYYFWTAVEIELSAIFGTVSCHQVSQYWEKYLKLRFQYKFWVDIHQIWTCHFLQIVHMNRCD